MPLKPVYGLLTGRLACALMPLPFLESPAPTEPTPNESKATSIVHLCAQELGILEALIAQAHIAAGALDDITLLMFVRRTLRETKDKIEREVYLAVDEAEI